MALEEISLPERITGVALTTTSMRSPVGEEEEEYKVYLPLVMKSYWVEI